MMSLVCIAMPGSEAMTARLAALAHGELATLETRHFPDGESYLCLQSDVSDKQVAVVCTLDRPDGKFLPMAYAAATARELGAARIGLVAPYLAYMRQDRRFRDGEAVTSVYFARLVSASFDWLVTVDPHLHRRASLDEIYTIPSRIVRAEAKLAGWIAHHVAQPVIVGPDAESEQWVSRIATLVQCPYTVLIKRRLGGRQVALELPDLSTVRNRKPVLVDDIISTATTMTEAAKLLTAAGLPKPVCVGIHGLFAGDSFATLSVVAESIVTTNTVAHRSNAIDLLEPIAATVVEVAQAAGTRIAAP